MTLHEYSTSKNYYLYVKSLFPFISELFITLSLYFLLQSCPSLSNTNLYQISWNNIWTYLELVNLPVKIQRYKQSIIFTTESCAHYVDHLYYRKFSWMQRVHFRNSNKLLHIWWGDTDNINTYTHVSLRII